MDFNLKALGAETVMVDRRLVAKLVEAELLLRDGEKLPYEEELNQFIRQNSFIGVNPSERLFAKCAVTGKNAECFGLMVKPREIVLAEEVYYRLQELETAESIQKEYLRKSKDGTPVRPLYEVRADFADNPSLSEEENRFIDTIRPREYCFEARNASEATRILGGHEYAFFSRVHQFLKEEKEAGIIEDISSRAVSMPGFSDFCGVRYGNLFIKTDFIKNPVKSCVYEKDKKAWNLTLEPKKLLKYDLGAIQKNVENLLEIGYRRLTKIESFWTTEALPEVKKFFDSFKTDSVNLQVGEKDSSLETVILNNCDQKVFDKLPLEEKIGIDSLRFHPKLNSDEIEPPSLDDKPDCVLKVGFSLNEKEAAKLPEPVRELVKRISDVEVRHTVEDDNGVRSFVNHDKQLLQELFTEAAEKQGVGTKGLDLFSGSNPVLKEKLEITYGSMSLPLDNPSKPPISISGIQPFNEEKGCYEAEYIPRHLYGSKALKDAFEQLGMEGGKPFPFSDAALKSGIDRKVMEEAAEIVRKTVKEDIEDFRFSFESQKLFIPKDAKDFTDALRFTVEVKSVELAKEMLERRKEAPLSKEHRESIEKIVGSFSKSREFQEHPQLSEALKNRLEEKFKAAEKAGIRLDLRHRDDPKKQSQDLER